MPKTVTVASDYNYVLPYMCVYKPMPDEPGISYVRGRTYFRQGRFITKIPLLGIRSIYRFYSVVKYNARDKQAS